MSTATEPRAPTTSAAHAGTESEPRVPRSSGPLALCTATIASPIGPIDLYAIGDELVGLFLPETRWPLASRAMAVPRQTPVLERAAAQLGEYFAGARAEFDLPLAPVGSAFQRIVWRALEAIPFGETRSYGELARAIGRPAASRAVGAANGKNPISIIVPCHRVIGASGDLTGYGGGMDAKRWLLTHEQRAGIAPRRDSLLSQLELGVR